LPWNQQRGVGIGNMSPLSSTFRLVAALLRKKGLRERSSESGSGRLFIRWERATKENTYN
jgi:hypothetical protein